ncbi:hypothetical protein K492DRAFT_171765 [Lichtheimia hyalospora FSU 10163]|nr:hypothetical protein K492DRAFT_171765 [Lichtheimia hyalospora FSU 10163]
MHLIIQLFVFILVSLRPHDVSALITGTLSCYNQQRSQCQSVVAHCRLMVLLMLRVIVVATVMLAGSLWDDMCAIRKGVTHHKAKKTTSAHPMKKTNDLPISENIQDQLVRTTTPPSSSTKDKVDSTFDLGETTPPESKPTTDKVSAIVPDVIVSETTSCSQESTLSIEQELPAEEQQQQQQQQQQPLASSNACNDATVTATDSSVTAGGTAAEESHTSNDVAEQQSTPTPDVVDKQPPPQQQQVPAVEDETMTQSPRTSDKQQNNEIIETPVEDKLIPSATPPSLNNAPSLAKQEEKIASTPSPLNNESSAATNQEEQVISTPSPMNNEPSSTKQEEKIVSTPSSMNNESSAATKEQDKRSIIATPPPPSNQHVLQENQQTLTEAVPAKRHGNHEEEETASSSDETIPTPPERQNNNTPAKNSRLLNMAARAAAGSPQQQPQQQPQHHPSEEPKRSFSLRLNRSSSSNLRAKFDSLVHRNQNSDKPPRPSKQPFASLSRSLRRSKTPVTSDNASTTSSSTKRLQGTRKRLSNLFQS